MHLPKEKIIDLAKDTIETLGYFTVEMRLITVRTRKELKAVIYHPEKDISMDDCTTVSNVLRRRMELEDPSFSESFDLVIESPGVDRKISSLEEVLLFKDKDIRFVLKQPADYGLKDNVLIGMVLEVKDGVMKIDSFGRDFSIPWSEISSAKLYFDIKKYL